MMPKYSLIVLVLMLSLLTGCPYKKAAETFHGQVEMDEIDLASRISARVSRLAVRPGDRVEPGQVLVELDDDLLAIKNDRAQVGIQQAELQKQLVDQATRREELTQLAAAVRLAQSQWDFASKGLKRARQLFAQGAIAAQQLEDIISKEAAAKAQLDMARARREAGTRGAREEQKALAAASVAHAQTGLAEVSAYEKDLKLLASLAAVVQAIHARPGELVPQGFPIVTLLDHDNPRLSFYVLEDKLGAFAKDSVYNIKIPALGKTIKAQLVRMQVMPPVLTQVVTEARSTRDLRSFELTFRPVVYEAALQAGMSVTLEEPRHAKAP